MNKGETLHAFRISEREGQALLTAQERVAGCSDNVRRIFANAGCLQKHGFVAYYDTDRPFCIFDKSAIISCFRYKISSFLTDSKRFSAIINDEFVINPLKFAITYSL